MYYNATHLYCAIYYAIYKLHIMERRITAVKNLIISKEWPLRWVAEQIGVSIPTVYRWVNEDVKSVTETHLEQLASLAELNIEFSPDRKECQFVAITEHSPQRLELPAGFLDRIKTRIIRNQTNQSKFNKSPKDLFFEGEDLLEKIYNLKIDDHRMIKQLIERLSQKEY